MKLKIGSLFLVLSFIFLSTGCNSQPATIFSPTTPTGVEPTATATVIFPPTETAVETVESTPTYPPTPTLIPASWLAYSNPVLHLKFRYPENWKPTSFTPYNGQDGYFTLTMQSYAASEFDSFSTLCLLEANKKKPAIYGTSPYISTWQGWDPQKGIWAGIGCIVTPAGNNSGTPNDQAVLFARYPEPWPRNTLLVLRADSAHFDGILSTLQFTNFVTPTPHPVNYYNSPACEIPLAIPNVKISHSAGLTITEYPLVNAGCDPMEQFDGFQARVRNLDLDNLARYNADRLLRAEQANRMLELFGYHLVGHQEDLGGANTTLASRKITIFDLFRGNEKLRTGLTQIGPVSENASGDDFILWVEDTDNLLATEVRRDSLKTLNWWESGFNTAWVGSDMVKVEFAKDHLSPVGAPSQAIIYRDDQEIYKLAIPQSGPAGNPVEWLYSWEGHWTFEVNNVVVEDGELQNPKFGFGEMFEWHLVNDKPFYFSKKGDAFGLSYAGETLPQRYNDIIHGQLCCEPAVYSINSLSNGAWFYALREDTWYLVSALVE